jgi:hypothetical protein
LNIVEKVQGEELGTCNMDPYNMHRYSAKKNTDAETNAALE